MTPLWVLIRPHLFWVVVVSGMLFGFHEWIAEHDARIRADIQVKDAQTVIDSLQKQIDFRQLDTQKQVQVIVKQVQAAKTPAQQLAEIPKLETQPLNPVLLPDAPSAVKVELAPLLAELAKCKEDSIRLTACTADVADFKRIQGEQNKQVTALQKKRGFWHRFTSDTKKMLIAGAVGAVAILIAEKKL